MICHFSNSRFGMVLPDESRTSGDGHGIDPVTKLRKLVARRTFCIWFFQMRKSVKSSFTVTNELKFEIKRVRLGGKDSDEDESTIGFLCLLVRA